MFKIVNFFFFQTFLAFASGPFDGAQPANNLQDQPNQYFFINFNINNTNTFNQNLYIKETSPNPSPSQGFPLDYSQSIFSKIEQELFQNPINFQYIKFFALEGLEHMFRLTEDFLKFSAPDDLSNFQHGQNFDVFPLDGLAKIFDQVLQKSDRALLDPEALLEVDSLKNLIFMGTQEISHHKQMYQDFLKGKDVLCVSSHQQSSKPELEELKKHSLEIFLSHYMSVLKEATVKYRYDWKKIAAHFKKVTLKFINAQVLKDFYNSHTVKKIRSPKTSAEDKETMKHIIREMEGVNSREGFVKKCRELEKIGHLKTKELSVSTLSTLYYSIKKELDSKNTNKRRSRKNLPQEDANP